MRREPKSIVIHQRKAYQRLLEADSMRDWTDEDQVMAVTEYVQYGIPLPDVARALEIPVPKIQQAYAEGELLVSRPMSASQRLRRSMGRGDDEQIEHTEQEQLHIDLYYAVEKGKSNMRLLERLMIADELLDWDIKQSSVKNQQYLVQGLTRPYQRRR